jgi:PAS domain S-box-containing protein
MLTNKDSRKYNILVIEDNLGDFILIEDYLLEYLVPNLVRAGSLKEARELLHSNNTGFDLVMLDLTLPDSTGADLITQIIDMCPDLPIIVLTGYGDFEFSIKSLALGVSDYLLKDELTPFSLYKSLVYNIERKKTHSELEESRKRYSNLFHLSPDPTWVLDVSTNRFLDVNDAAIREYGFTHDEFLAMTVEQVETENDPEAAAAPHLINSPEYDKTHLREIYRHRKKNGDIIYVENQTSEILFNGKGAKIMVVHDITERIKYINAI